MLPKLVLVHSCVNNNLIKRIINNELAEADDITEKVYLGLITTRAMFQMFEMFTN